MARIKYQHGDQVEVRLVVHWTPSEGGVMARTVSTVWRGDINVDQTVSQRFYPRNKNELLWFAAAFIDGLWMAYERDVPFHVADGAEEQMELPLDPA